MSSTSIKVRDGDGTRMVGWITAGKLRLEPVNPHERQKLLAWWQQAIRDPDQTAILHWLST